MLNWTEEDLKFIAEELIAPIFKEYIDIQQNADDLMHNSYAKTFDIIATRIRELGYERQRDKAFFLSYLGKLDRLYDVNKIYENFCEEYDKHNKHLLEVSN